MDQFDVIPFKIDGRIIVKLPDAVSRKLPSRGAVSVEGSLNGTRLKTWLEPDGQGAHWFAPASSLIVEAGIESGKSAALAISVANNGIEPNVPDDVMAAMRLTPDVMAVWQDISTAARWDWLRWIRSTRKAGTRMRRIEAACDKMLKGERRPCCFNRSLCTDITVSCNGLLLEPDSTAG